MSATRNRREAMASGVLALALTVALCACGVPADNKVHLIDPQHVPSSLIAPATPPSTSPTAP